MLGEGESGEGGFLAAFFLSLSGGLRWGGEVERG